MRGALLVVGVLAFARADADELRSPPRWQQASGAASIARVWGIGNELYGVGASGAFHSSDGGATWAPADGAGPATGVWGSAIDDVWIVHVYAVGSRGVVLHSWGDGGWTIVRQPSGPSLEGIWGASATSIYAVGANGVILHSADRGKTWTRRLSGASYTLSSIVGTGGEILVGSADGVINSSLRRRACSSSPKRRTCRSRRNFRSRPR